MEYVKLNNTDLKVSRIGFGCYQLPLISKAQSSKLIQTALDQGINFFETARDYRNSEEKLGNAIHNFPSIRDQIILATKIGAKKPINLRKTLNMSLRKLQTDYIDIYSMEGVNTIEKFNNYQSTVLPELKQFKREGIIGCIGMSSHNINVIKEAKKWEDVSEIEVYFTPANIMLRDPIRTNIPFVAIKPFGGYKYSYVQGQDVKYVSDTREFGRWFNPEIALNYLLQFNHVKSVLCGFTSTRQILDDCKVEKERIVNIRTRQEFKFTKFEDYCNQCDKCSCPNGIRIPFLMKLWELYDFYGIKRWTKTCYNMLDADVRDCDNCGECEFTCKRNVKIREILNKLEKELRE